MLGIALHLNLLFILSVFVYFYRIFSLRNWDRYQLVLININIIFPFLPDFFLFIVVSGDLLFWSFC